MSPEENIQNQDRPVEEKPVVLPSPNEGRNQQGPRRPRFKPDNRGDRRNRNDRPPRREERPRAPGEVHHTQASSIRKAIEQVERIRNELKKTLDDIHETMEILDQVEREKTASEEEIASLRESLRQLHSDHGHSRNFRAPPPPRHSPAPEPDSPPTDAEAAEPQSSDGPF